MSLTLPLAWKSYFLKDWEFHFGLGVSPWTESITFPHSRKPLAARESMSGGQWNSRAGCGDMRRHDLAQLHSPLLNSTLFHYTTLYSTLPHSTPLNSTQLYSTLLHSTPLYPTLLHSTKHYTTQLYSRFTLLHSTHFTLQQSAHAPRSDPEWL